MHWTTTTLQNRLETATNDCLNASASVSDAVFFDNSNGKWSIAENLIHLQKGAKRLGGALALPKEQIANFGLATKPSRTYEAMRDYYAEALKTNFVVPKAFTAEQTADDTRPSVLSAYTQSHANLNALIPNFSETDLDTYQIPHPRLGLLTLREMLYFMVYHIGHHQKAVDRIVLAPINFSSSFPQ